MLAIKESEFSSAADLAVQYMSNKWTIQIVKELLDGPKRPCELYKAMPGISSKVLNQRLKYLVEIGIVSQHKMAGKTLFTQYKLTELGKTFEDALCELEKFGTRLLEASNRPGDSGEHRDSSGPIESIQQQHSENTGATNGALGTSGAYGTNGANGTNGSTGLYY